MNYVMAGRSIGAVLGGSQRAASNGLLTGLVAYWKLDEASGNAIDAHSNALTLTAANAPGSAAGKIYATARTGNNSNQYFYRASEAALQLGDIDFALAAWIWPADEQNNAICAVYGTVQANRSILFNINAGNCGFYCTNSGGTQSSAIAAGIDTFAWSLCMAWHDATANKIYVQIDDGTPVESAHSGGARVSTDAWTIAALTENAFSIPLNGRIGPVAMWKNRTLSAADRAALWNGGAGLAYSGFTA